MKKGTGPLVGESDTISNAPSPSMGVFFSNGCEIDKTIGFESEKRGGIGKKRVGRNKKRAAQIKSGDR